MNSKVASAGFAYLAAILWMAYGQRPEVRPSPEPGTPPEVVYPPNSGIFNVRDFGAKGDGIADDTAAIRAAIATVLARGNVVYFPAGTYLISDTLYWALDGNPAAEATAHLDPKRGCIADIGLQNGGHGYIGSSGGGPGVLLLGGGGSGAAAFARLSGDSVAAITVNDGKSCAGSGYASAPAVKVVNFRAWMRFQGQNQATTIIRLRDKSPGFDAGNCVAMYNFPVLSGYCKAMLFAASAGASNPFGAGEAAYFDDIFDMTIDAGSGNPGATAIDWAASNTAAIRNVKIVGTSGRVGLNTSKGWGGGGNGPALIKNLTVNGFDYGIVAGAGEVGLTFEHVALTGQRTAGLWNQNQNVWIRDLKSANSVPGVINQDNGNMALIDSVLSGGSHAVSAILNQGATSVAHLYARNVTTAGYASAIRQGQGTGVNAGSATGGTTVREYASHGVIALSPPAEQSLNLPVRETPAPFVDNDFANWAVVTAYGAIPNDQGDDTGGIQAALNSRKPTVFLPAGSYRISGTLHIPFTVRRIMGVISQITIANGKRAGYPVFSCDAATGGPIEIRSLTFDKNTVGQPSILNNCGVPLVIADVFDVNGYENTPGKGLEVYFENAAIPGGVTQHGGNVWARQLDVENESTHVVNDGANFWVLGYKTEGVGAQGLGLFHTRNGGSSEVIGAFNSTPGGPPFPTPGYTSVDSRISVAALSAGYLLQSVFEERLKGSVNRYPNNNTRYGGTAVSLYSGSSRSK